MKYGLLITTFNRPEYLKQCFESLASAGYPNDLLICIVDDCSTNLETTQLIADFNISNIPIIKYRNHKNLGIKHSLQFGFNNLFACGCAVVMNLDSDAIVKINFFSKIIGVRKFHDNQIVTGFNCDTKNKDGSERHKIVNKTPNGIIRESVGGINMCFKKEQYDSFVLPALQSDGNWDHNACIAAGRAICVSPSVVQHIGYVSSMGHTSAELPDVADDFDTKEFYLPNITIIGVDCKQVMSLIDAMKKSCKNIKFGAAKILTDIMATPNDSLIEFIKIPHIKSKEAYSEFMIKEIHKYIDTEFMLVIQHDGYIVNYKAWDNKFLNYDYVGATWWYKDNMNVGNGGFSLRSKKLMEELATNYKGKCHPEDDVICRQERKPLESQGFNFPSEEIANKFSIENSSLYGTTYTGQFGFHGKGIKGLPGEISQVEIKKDFVRTHLR